MTLHEIPGTHWLQVAVPAAGASDATAKLAAVLMPFAAKVKYVKLVAATAAAGHGTNTQNLNVLKCVGGVFTEISHLDQGLGVDLVAGVPSHLGTGSALDVTLAAGDLIYLEREKVGTGVALGPSALLVAVEGA